MQKKSIINIIKNHNTDNKKVRGLIKLVKENGGLEYATKKMKEYHKKALTILEDFEDNDAKISLKKMMDFVIERKQ